MIQELSIYFSESYVDPQNIINILSVLNESIQSLSIAVKKYDERKKREDVMKQKQSKKESNKKPAAKKTTSPPKHQIGKNKEKKLEINTKNLRQLPTKKVLSLIIELSRSFRESNTSSGIEIINDKKNNAIEMKKIKPT